MKKKTAIVFRITPNLTFAVANVIIGIERYSPGLASEYIIFCSDVKDEKLNDLVNVTKKYKKDISFIEYNDEFVLKKTGLDFSSSWFKRYPVIIFSLFEIFLLLKKFECVITLDADMLVQDSIDELREFGDFCFRPARNLKDVCTISNIPDLCKTPNAGLLVVKDTLNNYENLTDQCYDILKNEFNNISNTYEETVIGLLIYKNKINCHYLDVIYNAPVSIINSKNKIIHAIHGNKFWEYGMKNIYQEWYINEKIYKKIIGVEYDNGISNKNLILEFYELYWKLMIEKYFHMINFNIYYDCNLKKNYLKLYIRNIKNNIHYELFIKRPPHFVLSNNFDFINKKNEIKYIILSLDVENVKNIDNEILNVMNVFTQFKFNIDINDNKISISKNISTENFVEKINDFIQKTWDFVHFISKFIDG